MSLGIFFPIGDSFENLERNGKLSRLVDYYLPAYKKKFDRIYIFSYGNARDFTLLKGCILVTNKWNIHRYIYTFLFPVIHFQILAKIKVIRVLQLSGIVSALIAKLFFGVKIAITYGYDYRRVEKLTGHKYKSCLYFLIDKFFLPICNVIIFSSQTIQNGFLKLKHKSIYIPNGIDLGKFTPDHNLKSSDKFSVLTQGRLSPEKNLGVLIKAVSCLPKRTTVLTIIGTGFLKCEMEQVAKKYGVNLRIIEKVPNDEMPNYYRQSNIYVHSSLTEGSPKSLIEAAACGCCILASDIPQNREILGDAAVYFEQEIDILKKKLLEIYKHRSLRIKYEQRARDRIIGRFDINALLLKETGVLVNLAIK